MTKLNDRKFTDALLALYERTVTETWGEYDPVLFRQMLNSRGGLGTVRKLIQKGQKEEDWAYGLKNLRKLERLDLSLEAFIVEKSRWRSWLASLGMQDYVEEAEHRLRKMGYKPTPDSRWFGVIARLKQRSLWKGAINIMAHPASIFIVALLTLIASLLGFS